MAKTKALISSNGDLEVTLPSDGRTVTVRSPRGKDLKVIQRLGKTEDTSIGLVMVAIAALSDLTVAELDELPADDLGVLGKALEHFSVFSTSKPD